MDIAWFRDLIIIIYLVVLTVALIGGLVGIIILYSRLRRGMKIAIRHTETFEKRTKGFQTSLNSGIAFAKTLKQELSGSCFFSRHNKRAKDAG